MIRLVIGIVKTALLTVLFFAGVASVVFSQCVGLLVSLLIYQTTNTELAHAWISRTKSSFIVILTTVLTCASKRPIHIRITSANLDKDRLISYTDGSIATAFSPHAVYFGNHQIYTDWAYIWWLSYTSDLAGFFYILLKAELRKLPLLGFGMACYDFAFLTRKWVVDKITMAQHLDRWDANARGKGPASGAVVDSDGKWPKGKDPSKSWPYQVLIFPEGTNMSDNTRVKTEAYAAKVGKKPFKHVLLPKTTGLRYTLLRLKDTVDEVYDLTIGYSGVKPDEYGQDIYRLPQVFFYGVNPDIVDIHIRVLRINEIPIGKLDYEDPEEEKKDQKIFEDWLFDVWEKKDKLMDKYYATGSFTDGNDTVSAQATTQLKVDFTHLLQSFAIPAIFLILLRLAYLFYNIRFNPSSCPASAPNTSPSNPFNEL